MQTCSTSACFFFLILYFHNIFQILNFVQKGSDFRKQYLYKLDFHLKHLACNINFVHQLCEMSHLDGRCYTKLWLSVNPVCEYLLSCLSSLFCSLLRWRSLDKGALKHYIIIWRKCPWECKSVYWLLSFHDQIQKCVSCGFSQKYFWFYQHLAFWTGSRTCSNLYMFQHFR